MMYDCNQKNKFNPATTKCFVMKLHLFLLIVTGLWACKPIPVANTVSSPASGAPSSSSSVIIIPKKGDTTPKPEEAPTVTIDWLSPTSADLSVKSVGGKVEIKLRINSSAPINLDQIDILVNGKPSGNKAGEVGLMRRPEFKDQILTAQVPITEGSNDVQVVVILASDRKFVADCKLEKTASGIRLIPAPVSSASTRVTWVQPDAYALKPNEPYNTKTRELEVRFTITTPDLIEKKDIQVLVNKVFRAPSPAAELRGGNGAYSFKDVVTLKDDVPFNEIGLKVNARSGASSAQPLKVNYSPIRPNLYILAIGTQLNLKYAVKDARDFANIFMSQAKNLYGLYNSVIVDTLLGKAATTNEIRGSVESIKNKIKTGAVAEDDVVMLFISSHGTITNGDFRIQGDDYSPQRPTTTSVSFTNDLMVHLNNLPCKKLIFIDACHSGGARANVADINSALKDLQAAPNGFAVFTSSSGDEESHEDIYWANGAFTEALIEGLKDGKADGTGFGNGNGIITLKELEAYVTQTVPIKVQMVKQKQQHPTVSKNELGNIAIFVIKK